MLTCASRGGEGLLALGFQQFGPLLVKAWPFEEARKILKRIGNKTPEKGYVLFETGYGPSGLPHIGTFGEVARTTMVRNAFSVLSDIPTRLIAFSDDLDGLRKVPENVPNEEMLKSHLGKPRRHCSARTLLKASPASIFISI